MFGIDPALLRLLAGCLIGLAIGLWMHDAAAKPESKTPPRPMAEKLVDLVSFAGIATGILLWSGFYWDRFHPERTSGYVSYAMWLLVVGLGICTPLALPLLITKALPRDPFHLDVQRRMQDTAAHKIQIGVTIGWSLFCARVMYGWIGGALGITNTEDILFTTVSLSVVTTFIPSLAILQFIPKQWKALLEMADYVEQQRRKNIAEQIEIEAAMAQAILLMTMGPIQSVLDQRADKKLAAELVGAALVRVNESSRVVVNLLAQLTRNKHLQLRTPGDDEIYNHLERAFLLEDDLAKIDITPEPVMREVGPKVVTREQGGKSRGGY